MMAMDVTLSCNDLRHAEGAEGKGERVAQAASIQKFDVCDVYNERSMHNSAGAAAVDGIAVCGGEGASLNQLGKARGRGIGQNESTATPIE